MTKKILVIGDTHGEWGELNKLIQKKNPEIVLQCGDFGYWPKFSGTNVLGKQRINHDGRIVRSIWHQCGIKNHDIAIHFCDGNHEDHWALADLDKKNDNQICPKVFYQKRGSILTLPDGRNVLFMGGADSIDKEHRTVGLDWFPEEYIRLRDVIDLPDMRIDVVISHTCPEEFLYNLKFNYIKSVDPSCKALSYILEKYQPKQWFFGHWHQFKEGSRNGCYWTCLNMAGDSGWWTWLK